MEARMLGLIGLALALVFIPCNGQEACKSSCPSAPDGFTGFYSNLAVGTFNPRSLTVEWMAHNGEMYHVEHRREGTNTFTTSEAISGTSYTIEGLNPSTDYEIRVCLSSNSSLCGHCLLCASTIHANEPPSVPLNVRITSATPSSFTVSWSEPDITNSNIELEYTVEYGPDDTFTFNRTVFEESTAIFNEVVPNMNYSVRVYASNENGVSLPSDTVIAITPPLSDEPGSILVVAGHYLRYYRLTRLIFDKAFSGDFGSAEINAGVIIDTDQANITSLDYHYRREQIFASLDNGSIVSYDVSVTVDDRISLTYIRTNIVYNDRGNVVTMAVEWVTNVLYWAEYNGTNSQIYSGPIDGGDVRTIGQSIEGEIGSLKVDIIHGYLYFVVIDSALVRIPLSTIDNAQPDTDLMTNPNTTIETQSFVSAFAIDLADSRTFLSYGMFVRLSNLNGEEVGTLDLSFFDTLNSTKYMSSYGTAALISSPALRVRDINPEENGNLGLIVPNDGVAGNFNFTAISTFQPAFQPLPVPPDEPSNVRISVTSDSVTVTWDAPVFFDPIFSSSAYDDWEYTIEYREGSDVINSTTMSQTTHTQTSLTPGQLYSFTLTVSGPGDPLNAETYFFTTYSTEEPPLIITVTDQGIASSDGSGDSYIGDRGSTDTSSDVTYNIHLNIYFVYREGEEELIQGDGDTFEFLARRVELFGLQVDWIGRRLFWVEGLTIYSASTDGLNSGNFESRTETFEEETVMITDTAIDSLSGLFFWNGGVEVKAKSINGLWSYSCVNLSSSPEALTVDPVNSVLFYVIFTSNQVTVGRISYSRFSCDSTSQTEHIISQLSLDEGLGRLSMSYSAKQLFLIQSGSTDRYFFTSEFGGLGENDILAIGVSQIVLTSPTATEFRHILVSVSEVQPLPDGLSVSELGNVAPPLPGPPSLGAASTSEFISVTWAVPAFNFSDIFYTIQVNTTNIFFNEMGQFNGRVLAGNTFNISDQMFSTSVSARVRAYSLWQSSGYITGTFVSPPKVPSPVQNVRVYVYFPHRNSTQVSAQVVWDRLTIIEAGGAIDKYSVNVNDSNGPITDEGIYNGPPFITGNESSELTLAFLGIRRILQYPLKMDETYNVTVFATNSDGDGPDSEIVTFNTFSSSPPTEVFVVSTTAGQVVGVNGNISLDGVSPPTALNVANRTLYYYNDEKHAIYKTSLDVNADDELFTTLDSMFVPRSMVYDWIAQTVYIIGYTRPNNFVHLLRVFDLNPDVVEDLYDGTVSQETDVEMSIIVDPFSGYLIWTQYSRSTSNFDLFQVSLLDFRNVKTLLTSSRRRRNVNLSSLEPTAALAWDSVTGRIWLSDRITGNIVSCDSDSNECTVEVSATNVSVSDISEAGLPAASIALDEQHIYWTNNTSATIYYVKRSDVNTLLTLQSSSDGAIIIATSPGTQQLPPYRKTDGDEIDYCLSPILTNIYRPTQERVSITNTTITIRWNEMDLPPECGGMVVSRLPLTYTITVELDMEELPEYPMTTFEPMYTISGLAPFTTYQVHLEAGNQYTQGDPGEDVANYKTTEGVPDMLSVVEAVATGTRSIIVLWEGLEQEQLRGFTTNQSFRITINSTQRIEEMIQNTTFMTGTLTSSSNYAVEVSVSNGVFNSPAAVRNVRTFDLPPSPQLITDTLTNTSFTAMLDLNNPVVELLTDISIRIVNTETNAIINVCESGRANFSGNLTCTADNLQPNTDYSLITTGTYDMIDVDSLPDPLPSNPATDDSEPTVIRTSPGVPDAPVISFGSGSSNTLSWDMIEDNGATINMYRLHFTSGSDSRTHISNDPTLSSIDVSDIDGVEEGVEYEYTLEAINDIGPSNMSNSARHEIQPFWTTQNIAAVAGGGAAALILFVCMCVVCTIVCCRCTATKKKDSYGVDIELIKLRLSRQEVLARNPNYWSGEDCNFTSEALENLNKFPRNRLRLETFIDQGEFGEVYQGTAMDILGPGAGPTPVAVKTLKKGASEDEQKKFLSEAALMCNFNHQNIVKVLGLCLENDPIYIIMELMPAGDLLKFLRDARREHGPPLLTLMELLQIALDVAQGCAYLERQHFIHRDIAARNCLVSSKGSDRVVKIGDFGLAKDLYTQDYYQVEGQRKLPVRWMAPEALQQGKFTIESDIWSYGVLLWEIMSIGNQPYPGRTNQETLQFVTGGGRLDKPENCPGRIYKVMMKCWMPYPSERMHFPQIVDIIGHYLEHVNTRRDSYASDEDEELEDPITRRRRPGSSRGSSMRSGFMNFARQGSVRIRNSFRSRRGSLHRREETSQNSEDNMLEDDSAFRERGPF